jgi:4-amino-4-deoxy-L-arabinose transferase-like glycosyltransferase
MPGATFKAKLRDNAAPLLFLLLLLLAAPCRGLWSPDEPDFAQCVREMRERGAWLLPYLNGEPYNEKPILFYWLTKCFAIAGEWLSGGAGFRNGVAAWALRLPSALSAAAFVFAFRAWAARFAGGGPARTGALVLAATPIWVWQAQFIQIDMLFAALLAWSWLSWLAGYLVLRGHAVPRSAREPAAWFVGAYVSLGLAFLAKGPLAFVLSAALLAAFAAWQKDWRMFAEMRPWRGAAILLAVVSPWYVAAGAAGGADYAYNMVVHQNLTRALSAWDHIQPWWRYAEYMAGDFAPWTLLLPAAALFHFRELRAGRRAQGAAAGAAAGAPGEPGRLREPLRRFFVLAVLVPVLLLSLSQSKQGKYVLMVYPFAALLLGEALRRAGGGGPPFASRRARAFVGWLFAGIFGLAGAAALAVPLFGAGGTGLQAQIAPYLGPMALIAMAFLFGACLFARGAARGSMRLFARDIGITVGLASLAAGTWGFRLLEPRKGYGAWTEAVGPHIAGRRVNFWQTIRSGAMVYTDSLTMPELGSAAQLEALPPGALLVATERDWASGQGGLADAHRAMFETLVETPVGGGGFMLLRKRQGAAELL